MEDREQTIVAGQKTILSNYKDQQFYARTFIEMLIVTQQQKKIFKEMKGQFNINSTTSELLNYALQIKNQSLIQQLKRELKIDDQLFAIIMTYNFAQ